MVGDYVRVVGGYGKVVGCWVRRLRSLAVREVVGVRVGGVLHLYRSDFHLLLLLLWVVEAEELYDLTSLLEEVGRHETV